MSDEESWGYSGPDSWGYSGPDSWSDDVSNEEVEVSPGVWRPAITAADNSAAASIIQKKFRKLRDKRTKIQQARDYAETKKIMGNRQAAKEKLDSERAAERAAERADNKKLDTFYEKMMRAVGRGGTKKDGRRRRRRRTRKRPRAKKRTRRRRLPKKKHQTRARRRC
jgi:hypothetical protein